MCTQIRIMEEMNLTRRQVQKDIKELQNEGMLAK
ncbi:MAG: helix-turn-helix domain-containing protein [Lachnospiraceae bacterium]|nr:helix-turn-helix domain-containing protein [Lachnospiraceae bacterium]